MPPTSPDLPRLEWFAGGCSPTDETWLDDALPWELIDPALAQHVHDAL